MKKLTVIAIVACMALFAVSCKNQPKEEAVEAAPATTEVAPAAEPATEPAAEVAPAAEAAPAAEENVAK